MSEADTDAVGGRSEGVSVGEEITRPDDDRRRTAPSAGDASLVLIVEDEEPIAEALALVVRDAGFRSMVAAHGLQALEMARADPPALVITDLMMPHLDGAELIAALRSRAALDGGQAPPIILVTAAGPRRALAAGADAVLRKPFELAALERLLRRFLGTTTGA